MGSNQKQPGDSCTGSCPPRLTFYLKDSKSKDPNTLKNHTFQLPVPDSDALAHSQRLTDVIVAEIQQHGGRISFERFMTMVLYEPGLGYYVSGSQKFGTSGDFVTAPELSPLFSYGLARRCAEIFDAMKKQSEISIIEFGAGTGVMAADLLMELERLGKLPDHYYILEVSADLKWRQQQTIQQKAGHLLHCVSWLDKLPDDGIRGIVLANEVLDAMPVHRFFINRSDSSLALGEYYVGWEQDRFKWQTGPCTSAELQTKLENLATELPDNYISEINLAATGWINSVAQCISQGVVLVIDYGFPEHEFYHTQRTGGTLMCHYRHRSHTDPFLYPGLQDVTAHVNFSDVAQAAHDAGLAILGFCNQAFFLLGNHIEEYAQQMENTETEYMKFSQQLKTLTMPGEMGELFKVIALGKSFDVPLQGFSIMDNREKL